MVVFLVWISCSVFCYFIMKSKGYPNDRCWTHCVGGFLLGFIWLIVVLCKKPYNETTSDNSCQNEQGNPVINPQQPIQDNVPQKDYISSPQNITQRVALEAIERMADLREKGILTSDEFEQKKSELLKRI